MKYALILFTIFIFLSCTKDKEILTGEIRGVVDLFNVDYNQPHDKSGVVVDLFMDGILKDSTLTDTEGRFHFYDIPYGSYHVNLQKDSFVLTSPQAYNFHHVGGGSPTITEFALFRIPTFELSIDSLVRETDSYYYFDIYWKIDGDTILPYWYYPVVLFCNNTPDVSLDNYTAFGWAYLSRGINQKAPYGRVSIISPAFEQLTPGTIYVRFYPVAFAQNNYIDKPINRAALGKPSNVASLFWNDQ
jgi:hypothetical protein